MKLGSIVKSTSGHDGGSFYVVVKLDDTGVYIADGRCRKLEKPKCKNTKHLIRTNEIVDLADITTNKKIRRVLWKYNFPHQPVAD